MLKTLTGIILVICLLFPFMGNYLLLRRQIRQVRREVRATIAQKAEAGDLKLLVFSKKQSSEELEWKRDDEFKYNDEMFDVMRRTESKDSLFLLCWPDKQENVLNKKLLALLSFALEDDHPFKSNSEHIKTLFKKHFVNSLLKGLNYARSYKLQDYVPYAALYSSIFTELSPPPPKS